MGKKQLYLIMTLKIKQNRTKQLIKKAKRIILKEIEGRKDYVKVESIYLTFQLNPFIIITRQLK